jgi:hypothetical protein
MVCRSVSRMRATFAAGKRSVHACGEFVILGRVGSCAEFDKFRKTVTFDVRFRKVRAAGAVQGPTRSVQRDFWRFWRILEKLQFFNRQQKKTTNLKKNRYVQSKFKKKQSEREFLIFWRFLANFDT